MAWPTTKDLSKYAYNQFKGNFLGFVGTLGSRTLVRRAVASFREHASFPSEGVAAPGFIPGVDWSDHWSYGEYG